MLDVQCSMFEVHQFLIWSDWSLAASGLRLYETLELRRVGHRADQIPAGTVARPTLSKFLFRFDRLFFGRQLG